MIYHQFLEICYSILFDQESEKTQKLQVSVGKFPFLNKTFGVKFRNIFLQNMLYLNYIDDWRRKGAPTLWLEDKNLWTVSMRSYNRRDFFLAHDSLRFNKGIYMWQSPSTISIIANQPFTLLFASGKLKGNAIYLWIFFS